jgi:hypothetical protein
MYSVVVRIEEEDGNSFTRRVHANTIIGAVSAAQDEYPHAHVKVELPMDGNDLYSLQNPELLKGENAGGVKHEVDDPNILDALKPPIAV